MAMVDKGLSKYFRSNQWRCSVKKMFLKIKQISQESSFVGASFNNVGLKS